MATKGGANATKQKEDMKKHASMYTVPLGSNDIEKLVPVSFTADVDHYRRKGFKVCNIKPLIIAQHGDDFVRNRITVRIEYNLYKKPRIVK